MHSISIVKVHKVAFDTPLILRKNRVIDLSTGARATGQGPLGCYNGNTPGGETEWCQFGTDASPNFYACNVGPDPDPGAGWEICISGVSPALDFCMIGTGGWHYTDTCTVGPSAF
jgi:hypothetical protein